MNEDELAAFLADGSTAGPADGPGGEAERGAARHLRDLLADGAVWAEPPTGGADALVETIRAGAPAAPEVEPRRGRPAVGTRRPSRWNRGLTIAAVAAVVLLVAGIATAVMLRSDDGGEARELAIAGTEIAPGASAVATVETLGSGVAIELDVRDLPPAPPGTYYQAWVKGPDGLVTVGTFHLRGGDDQVELWAGVDLERYPTLTVTLQEEGAGQESSGQVVLSGDVGP